MATLLDGAREAVLLAGVIALIGVIWTYGVCMAADASTVETAPLSPPVVASPVAMVR